METPAPITAEPVPCDLAREHCTEIYDAYRTATHYDTIALMMMAYRKAYLIGQRDAFQEARDMVRAMPPVEAMDDDDRSIMDIARELKEACDHHDAIKADRRALAREHNASLKVTR